jgi:hypothetical protein
MPHIDRSLTTCAAYAADGTRTDVSFGPENVKDKSELLIAT